MKQQIDEIKALYLDNDGSEEGWIEWARARAGEEAAAPARREIEFPAQLLDFEVKDLDGKTWRLADLKGKATFIDVWATWCGPCRGEHPELQRMYEKIRNRDDIQLLTFSADEHAYGVAFYMEENNYTFPVIVSKTLTGELLPYMGLPSGWIVNPEGRRSSLFRFRGIERTLEELEKVAGQADSQN
jgi:thiol-disulfide isomerase/thioredoxin